MKSRSARCHCGSLELACSGDPRKISMCHCRECQRRTGSPFSVAVFYERSRFEVRSGTSEVFERSSASGFPVRFHFCPRCGSNVYWEPARMPDLVGVAVGAFADPTFPQPEQSVWTREKHPWIRLPQDVAAFELSPPHGGARR
ncbi:MAG TPA: GFA family protein [Candidatus Binatia bacterium]|nr:GFA family protein [Candidatus Binatia bacterium]